MMKSSLLMQFTIDRQHSSVKVQREFMASLSAVWSAWTEADLLDQWWAPRPWITRTKEMDFTNGGHWLYAMEGPDGTRHWCRADYRDIDTLKRYAMLDAFCNEDGRINRDMPRSDWSIVFEELDNSTVVRITIEHETLAQLDKIMEMGFKEGFTAALTNLDELLEKLSSN